MHAGLLIPAIDRMGGAERQVLLLAEGLRRRGWRVSVVALSGTGGDALRELREHQVQFVSLGFRKGLADPRGWLRFRRWLGSERPDLLHGHLAHAAWLARSARFWRPAAAVVDTLHSTATGGWGRRIAYGLSRGLPDAVTAVSYAVAETHLRTHLVYAGTLQVVPNGIDFGRFAPNPVARQELRASLGAGNAFLWIAAGRLDSVKDYPTLLRAMAALGQEDAILLIAGSGPQEEKLQALASWLGIGPQVRFLGFRPDLERWMQAADAFVLSSRWEGMPLALLEAAGCALPIVATDVPGTREAVERLGAGRLVAAGDPVALAAGMRELMHRPPSHLHATAERARNHAQNQFGVEAVLDRWEAIYSGLIAGKRSPRGPATASQSGAHACDEEPSLRTSAR